MSAITVFERTEKKYLLTISQMEVLINNIYDKIISDRFGKTTVLSLYFDTEDYRLIRTSIDKPIYKEKLRLRCYSVPTDDSEVFLELKKKYKGTVYKRRQTMTYKQAELYYNNGLKPTSSQIMKEIDWVMQFYPKLKPRIFIGYDRTAYVGKENPTLRITFDRNLRYRINDLDLRLGDYGESIIDKAYCIMEIKALGSMPLWLTKVLTEMKIYPASFSKYGTAYKIIKNGGTSCA